MLLLLTLLSLEGVDYTTTVGRKCVTFERGRVYRALYATFNFHKFYSGYYKNTEKIIFNILGVAYNFIKIGKTKLVNVLSCIHKCSIIS